ncbi:MAG: hypothetical protein EOO16_15105 [Chitinophagaceae bacterium]|nr:MAG: hypothetical protein EOO16_15105 [Chitinophagaceae bacterium]
MEPNTNACHQCGHALRGRSDKKFCNDYCRNAHNNALKSTQYTVVRRVNAVLTRNRRVLAELLGQEESTKASREELLLRGFQFRYHTHQYVNQRGATYHFCYEYGWLELASGRLLLVRREGGRPGVHQPGRATNNVEEGGL